MSHDQDPGQQPRQPGFSNEYSRLQPAGEYVQEREGEPGTPEEELRETLSEAVTYFGSTRSLESTRLPLELARRLFPDLRLPGEEGYDEEGGMKAEFSGVTVANGDVVEIPGYQRHDYSIYFGNSEPAGLTVTIAERPRDLPGDAIEPIRAGIGLSNESGSLFVDVTMPSLHGGETPDENPAVNVSLSDGADLDRMIEAAKDGLRASELDPAGQVPTPKIVNKLMACLDHLRLLVAATGTYPEDRPITEDAMLRLNEWMNLYFYDTRPDPQSSPTPVDSSQPQVKEYNKGPGSRSWGRRTIEPLEPDQRRLYPYGDFAERLVYEDGLTVSKEVGQGSVVTWIAQQPDGARYRIYIGRTPQGFSTDQPDAKAPGEFLLTKQELDKAADVRYAYLDAEDVHELEVMPGREVAFPGNDLRRRRIHLPTAKVQPGLIGYR